MQQERYDGFDYPASAISKYIYSRALGLFTIALKNDTKTLNYMPEDPDTFKAWLDAHDVRDLNKG